MAYFAKSTVLHAYKLLSGIDSEKQQGLTQKVSALKYASALDLFYKIHNQNCNLKQSANRDEFASYVGEIVKINEDYCTKDFFLSISQNGRDFDCGSNFYSQSSVKDSKTNPSNVFLYPKRSGWKPVMDIKDQVLIYRVDYLNDCFSFYLGSSELRMAFIVWLLRFKQISKKDLNGIKNALNTIFTNDYCEALYTSDVYNIDTSYVKFDKDVCQLSKDDVESLFTNNSKPYTEKTNIMNLHFQQIFYGAPGTGKSYEIKIKTKGKSVIRTTFHPDSDYSTFVGAYKPTMEEAEVRVVPVVVNNGISLDQNNGTYKENKIVYKFVKQAFLKAYLLAWKQYVDCKNAMRVLNDGESSNEKNSIIVKVDGNDIYNNNSMASAGRAIVETFINLSRNSSDIYEIIEDWNSKIDLGILFKLSDKKETINAHWKKLYDDYYFYQGIEGDNWAVFCERVRSLFESKGHSIEIKSKEVFSYESQINNKIDNVKELSDSGDCIVFLIIEEINRGNCAQIFGDIFQLLDRQDNGFSEYPIEADTDLQRAIKTAFESENEYKLNNSIDVEWAVEDYTSNYGKTLSEDIQEGRVMLFPPNLYIWATMNTSDQSLFPIDSAFKRRWEWKYIPIDTRKENWTIYVDCVNYDWSDFLDKINAEIEKATSSEDKMLGFYFCKAENGTITAERFVNKVLFYLWNDVFKDYVFDDNVFNDENNEKLTFRKFYMANGKVDESKVKRFLDNLKVKNDKTLEPEVQE